MKWPLTPTALDSKCSCLASDRYVLLHAVWDYVLGCMCVCVCVCGWVCIAVIQVIRFDLPNTLSLNVVLWQFIFYFSFHLRIFSVLVCWQLKLLFPLPPCPCLCLFCLSLSGAVKWNNWIVNRTIKYFIIIRFLLAARHSAIAFVSLSPSRFLSLSPSFFLFSCWP